MIPKHHETNRLEDALNAAHSAILNLQCEVERVEAHPMRSMRLALHTAYAALHRYAGAEGLSPSARKQIAGAIEMCVVELELETA